jgi:hypothetical protein
MPWIFNGLWMISKNIIPQKVHEKIHFVDTKSIREFITPENLLIGNYSLFY